jgi:hypothetical protein
MLVKEAENNAFGPLPFLPIIIRCISRKACSRNKPIHDFSKIVEKILSVSLRYFLLMCGTGNFATANFLKINITAEPHYFEAAMEKISMRLPVLFLL